MAAFKDRGILYVTTGDAARVLGLGAPSLRGLLNRGTVQDVEKRRYLGKKQRGFTRTDIEKIGRDLNLEIDQQLLDALFTAEGPNL